MNYTLDVQSSFDFADTVPVSAVGSKGDQSLRSLAISSLSLAASSKLLCERKMSKAHFTTLTLGLLQQ